MFHYSSLLPGYYFNSRETLEIKTKIGFLPENLRDHSSAPSPTPSLTAFLYLNVRRAIFGRFLKTPKIADFYLSNHSNSLDLQSYFVFRKVGNSGAFGFPADVPVWRHRQRAVTWQCCLGPHDIFPCSFENLMGILSLIHLILIQI